MTDSPTREDALLPCPFCGGEAISFMQETAEDEFEVSGCDECGLFKRTKDWNVRAGIVIDRDKVPMGLKEAISRSQKGFCREGDKRTVVEAAALLAEKVGG